MDVGDCTDCQALRDLHWDVQLRKSLHGRAVERERRWQRRAKEAEKQLRAQTAETERLAGQLEAAKAELVLLRQQWFGRRTERTKGSVEAGGDAPDAQDARGRPDSSSAPRRGRGKQPGARGNGRKRRTRLATEEISHDLGEDEKSCPACGKPLAPFPGTEDSEEIDWEVRFVRRVHKRKRYRPTCQCKAVPGIVTAPRPPKLIPKGLFSCEFWVELLLNKFLHGVPLYRILKMMEAENLSISQGTLTGGLQKIGALLQPLYVDILERARSARHWHMDETRWMVFAERAGKIGHRWWLWVICTADSCAYLLDPSRSARVPREFLGEQAAGILSADRYSAYKTLTDMIRIAFCWAHVRRDFLRIRDGHKKLALWAGGWVDQINALYRINRTRRAVPRGSDRFLAADRQLREALQQMAQRRDGELATATLHPRKRKALVSLREHWSGLTLFVDHPQIPMDNNEAERQLRLAVVGRKNYYGSGSIWSGALTAALFTILQTLLRNNINPKPWLRAYFHRCAENGGRVPDNVEEFLPWNLSEERKSQWQYQVRPP
jgi:transposase